MGDGIDCKVFNENLSTKIALKMNKNAKVVKLDTIVPKTPNKIYEQKMNIVYPEKEIATKVTYLDQLYSKEFNEDYFT